MSTSRCPNLKKRQHAFSRLSFNRLNWLISIALVLPSRNRRNTSNHGQMQAVAALVSTLQTPRAVDSDAVIVELTRVTRIHQYQNA